MKIFDLHNDYLTYSGHKREYRHITSEIIYAIWTTKLSVTQIKNIISNSGKKRLSIEDCGVFFDDFSFLCEYDFDYVGLTWNEDNGLAGGALSDGRLSVRGNQLISLLNEQNTVVDTAHLNKKSFFDVAERADKIICSHTCFDEVNRHPRNLTREQISAIINKGGIVGLCFVCDFLGGNSTDRIIAHVDWFLNAFGDKNLSIGSDFFGTDNLPTEIRSYENFDKLVLAMIKRGYNDSTIQKILFLNAASYFSKEVDT